jgi:hypothetical protein
LTRKKTLDKPEKIAFLKDAMQKISRLKYFTQPVFAKTIPGSVRLNLS